MILKNIKAVKGIIFFICLVLSICRIECLAEGVFYEILVRSFYDSGGDGIGDFKGLTEKLDYLNDGDPKTDNDLGINGIWLMPVLESPSYHGYDVSDYYKIEKDYGTENDFDEFINEAHKRGIKVIMDLVLNHTSSENSWFKDSCSNINNKRDWYVWEDKLPANWTKPWGGGESKDVWRFKNNSFYYAIFGDHMPDLNYNSEEVISEMEKVIEFWLKKGVDGFRLDAVRYLAEESGGVLGQADTEYTHKVLQRLSGYAKNINKDCILVGEVWADNKTASSYYGRGSELSNVFNFDLAGTIINSVRSNNYRGIEKALKSMNNYNVPEEFFCVFLANHDQNRIASELRGDIRRLKLAGSILLSMKGMPFMYYGEEIGMTGSGRHERIRTPMQWNESPNGGFSKGKPWENTQQNFKSINVSGQEKNPNSLLSHYRNLIKIRNSNKDIFKNKMQVLKCNNNTVYAYLYTDNTEGLVYIHNFSPSKQLNLNLYFDNAGFNFKKFDVIKTKGHPSPKIKKKTGGVLNIESLNPYQTIVLKALK